MFYHVYCDTCYIGQYRINHELSDIRDVLALASSSDSSAFYITVQGKPVSVEYIPKQNDVVRFNTRLLGGKGGFGSMLRAIGAQIEKTTNREACRDLSGRRLRDINEEKRLRKWLDGQSEREREAHERKQKKLEKLVAEPKIDVDLSNTSYEKERLQIPERVSAAVEAGWEAAGTSEGVKRKADDSVDVKKKKKKLWIDADLSDCSMSEDDDDDEDDDENIIPELNLIPGTPSDSGIESDRALTAADV